MLVVARLMVQGVFHDSYFRFTTQFVHRYGPLSALSCRGKTRKISGTRVRVHSDLTQAKKSYAYIDYLNSSRILANYDYAESHTVLINDILEHAHQEKENVPQKQLSRQTLGWIITDSFGGKVRVLQRGTRKHRERAYLNLRRRNLQETLYGGSSVSSESLPVSLKNMQLPDHWHYCIQDHNDQVSLIQLENWEFGGQRGITELLVRQSNHDNPDLVSLVVRAHGNSVDLNKEFGFKKLLGDRTIENQILFAPNYVDQSSLLWFRR